MHLWKEGFSSDIHSLNFHRTLSRLILCTGGGRCRWQVHQNFLRRQRCRNSHVEESQVPWTRDLRTAVSPSKAWGQVGMMASLLCVLTSVQSVMISKTLKFCCEFWLWERLSFSELLRWFPEIKDLDSRFSPVDVNVSPFLFSPSGNVIIGRNNLVQYTGHDEVETGWQFVSCILPRECFEWACRSRDGLPAFVPDRVGRRRCLREEQSKWKPIIICYFSFHANLRHFVNELYVVHHVGFVLQFQEFNSSRFLLKKEVIVKWLQSKLESSEEGSFSVTEQQLGSVLVVNLNTSHNKHPFKWTFVLSQDVSESVSQVPSMP